MQWCSLLYINIVHQHTRKEIALQSVSTSASAISYRLNGSYSIFWILPGKNLILMVFIGDHTPFPVVDIFTVAGIVIHSAVVRRAIFVITVCRVSVCADCLINIILKEEKIIIWISSYTRNLGARWAPISSWWPSATLLALRACLTSSFTPFGRSSRVTYALYCEI